MSQPEKKCSLLWFWMLGVLDLEEEDRGSCTNRGQPGRSEGNTTAVSGPTPTDTLLTASQWWGFPGLERNETVFPSQRKKSTVQGSPKRVLGCRNQNHLWLVGAYRYSLCVQEHLCEETLEHSTEVFDRQEIGPERPRMTWRKVKVHVREFSFQKDVKEYC